MQREKFKAMWEAMQRDGYFCRHPHYTDWFTEANHITSDINRPSASQIQAEAFFAAIDFDSLDITFPVCYSNELEKTIKRYEHFWLPRFFDLPSAGVALDLGCGFGRSIDWMQNRFTSVVGIDISETAVALARKRFKAAENVSFLTCDGNGLPACINDNSVDFIYCFTVFQHIPREFTLAYLNDFHRVLTQGGKVIFNLLSGENEELDEEEFLTEWSIGYNEEDVKKNIEACKLHSRKVLKWRIPKSEAFWLWFELSL